MTLSVVALETTNVVVADLDLMTRVNVDFLEAFLIKILYKGGSIASFERGFRRLKIA